MREALRVPKIPEVTPPSCASVSPSERWGLRIEQLLAYTGSKTLRPRHCLSTCSELSLSTRPVWRLIQQSHSRAWESGPQIPESDMGLILGISLQMT